MDKNRIITVLNTNATCILTEQSFKERMRKVYEILDREFPVTSLESAIFGPITSLVDFTLRGEIEPIMMAIKECSEKGEEMITSNYEVNSVLEYIYAHFR